MVNSIYSRNETISDDVEERLQEDVVGLEEDDVGEPQKKKKKRELLLKEYHFEMGDTTGWLQFGDNKHDELVGVENSKLLIQSTSIRHAEFNTADTEKLLGVEAVECSHLEVIKRKDVTCPWGKRWYKN